MESYGLLLEATLNPGTSCTTYLLLFSTFAIR